MGSQESNKEKDIVKSIAVVAAALGFAAWGMSKLFGSASETERGRKMMKAPGRDEKIYREDFERDPASYFRDLHKK